MKNAARTGRWLLLAGAAMTVGSFAVDGLVGGHSAGAAVTPAAVTSHKASCDNPSSSSTNVSVKCQWNDEDDSSDDEGDSHDGDWSQGDHGDHGDHHTSTTTKRHPTTTVK